MSKTLTRNQQGLALWCRLQHQRPTSDEVGMRENLTRTRRLSYTLPLAEHGGYLYSHEHIQGQRQWPDGQPEIFVDIVPDRAAFNAPVIHTAKNVGDTPLRGIVIEFKPERQKPPSK